MIEKKINYIDGNTVFNPERRPVDPQVEREYEKLKKAKKNRQLREKLKRKKARRATTEVILVMFVAGVFVIWGDNRVYKAENSLTNMKKAISSLQSENEAFNVQLLKSSSIYDIRNVAETKLGMIAPTKNDIIKVNLEKKNFKPMNEKSVKDGKSIFSKIKDAFF